MTYVDMKYSTGVMVKASVGENEEPMFISTWK